MKRVGIAAGNGTRRVQHLVLKENTDPMLSTLLCGSHARYGQLWTFATGPGPLCAKCRDTLARLTADANQARA